MRRAVIRLAALAAVAHHATGCARGAEGRVVEVIEDVGQLRWSSFAGRMARDVQWGVGGGE